MATIRLATEDDAGAVRAIYAPFCAEDSAVSFEVVVPTEAEIRRRIATTLPRFPWLVCEGDGGIWGYAYAGVHNERAAYRWSANVSAYIAEDRRGSGVGKALYRSLCALLRLQGFINAYAGITLPNPASVGLHRAMGFEPVGIYHQVGYKCGRWHDTLWLEKPLVNRPDPPPEPIATAEARTLPDWDRAMATGLDDLPNVDSSPPEDPDD